MATAVGVVALSGCAALREPALPAPVHTFVEPEYGAEYLLYRPSTYERASSWPVFVVCHTGWPGSPKRQMQAWAKLGESRGFLVVAPKIESAAYSVRRDGLSPADRLTADARRVVAVLRHVQAGHSVSEDRIFLYGYERGAAAALYCGLSNPDLFRAVAVVQPRFDEAAFGSLAGRTDPYLPVFVKYSEGNLVHADEARACADWLRAHTAQLVVDNVGPAEYDDARVALRFFEDVLRAEPWMRLQASPDPADPLTVRFRVAAGFEPKTYAWDFGDGQAAVVAEPSHTYAAPGEYAVSVTATRRDGATFTRAIRLAVPLTESD